MPTPNPVSEGTCPRAGPRPTLCRSEHAHAQAHAHAYASFSLETYSEVNAYVSDYRKAL